MKPYILYYMALPSAYHAASKATFAGVARDGVLLMPQSNHGWVQFKHLRLSPRLVFGLPSVLIND